MEGRIMEGRKAKGTEPHPEVWVRRKTREREKYNDVEIITVLEIQEQ